MSTPEPYGQASAHHPGGFADPSTGPYPVPPAQQNPQQFAVMPPQVVPPQVMVAQYGPAPQNGVGTGGFVTGLLGLILFWVPAVGIILAIIGVSLSGVGIAKAKRGEANNKGLATAGLTCGTIALAIWLIMVIAAVSVMP
ncbi:hypothetical protein ACFPM7_24900 [Actinokineospora guangxiensis]|uniref:DUF4190 domain-containing protein n=1 Tax=Actinokineospora guangxiensis TaxID=1490288 RepID=A0ABW0ESY4_9PSEU